MHQALLIEDSPEYQILVRGALADSFDVFVTSNADDALKALAQKTFDLILIDVGLPGKDGLALCQELRHDPRLKTTPILFVTGRRDPQDLAHGFEVGADDYVYKPFHPTELKARVLARIKCAKSVQAAEPQDQFQKADLRFSVGKQRVALMSEGVERELDLTPNEFRILYHLAKNEGRTLTRTEILSEVWGEKLHVVERTVDKHVCSLRRKMGSAAHYLASIPGQGYQFRAKSLSLAAAASGS